MNPGPPASDPRIATLLSSVMCPGAGHFYLKRWKSGLFFCLGFLASIAGLLAQIIAPLLHNLRAVAGWDAQQMDAPLVTISILNILIFFGLGIVFYLSALLDLRRALKKMGRKRVLGWTNKLP